MDGVKKPSKTSNKKLKSGEPLSPRFFAKFLQRRKESESNSASAKTRSNSRSQLPRLESQLAELEAQIKAAEERIARVQSVDSRGSVTTGAQTQSGQR